MEKLTVKIAVSTVNLKILFIDLVLLAMPGHYTTSSLKCNIILLFDLGVNLLYNNFMNCQQIIKWHYARYLLEEVSFA